MSFSPRLVDRRAHVEWLAGRRAAFAPALGLAALALVVQAALGALVANVWYRMAAGAVVLSTIALTRVNVGWRELFRPAPRHLWQGLTAAVVLYAAGTVVTRFLVTVPALAAQVSEVYGWRRAAPGFLAVPLLLVIVLGEEVVWRSAVTLPLAARLGPWTGTLAAASLFALAHLPMGVPVLLAAALGAGAFWGALVVKTRSAVPALLSHALWDLVVLFWLPYAP